MKTYSSKPGKRLDPLKPNDFTKSIKCKRCKTEFDINVGIKLNIESEAALYEDGNEMKYEKGFLGIFEKAFYRETFEQIRVIKSCCPTCGKTKKQFFYSGNPKQYEYSEWKRYN